MKESGRKRDIIARPNDNTCFGLSGQRTAFVSYLVLLRRYDVQERRKNKNQKIRVEKLQYFREKLENKLGKNKFSEKFVKGGLRIFQNLGYKIFEIRAGGN